MNAQEISFLKRTAWKGMGSKILTIPVEKLADACLTAWFSIDDPSFAEATLPSTVLQTRFHDLSESDDATQDDWNMLHDGILETLNGMTVEELAALFIDLNDPATIISVLWSRGDERYWDFECTMEY